MDLIFLNGLTQTRCMVLLGICKDNCLKSNTNLCKYIEQSHIQQSLEFTFLQILLNYISGWTAKNKVYIETYLQDKVIEIRSIKRQSFESPMMGSLQVPPWWVLRWDRGLSLHKGYLYPRCSMWSEIQSPNNTFVWRDKGN